MQYLGAKWDSIDAHYRFSDGHLANVKGYESYGKMAKVYGKLKDPAARTKMTDFYVSIQIVGTPDDCIQQLGELQRLTGSDHVVCDFSYGRMPPDKAELNMRHFAERVLPVMQRDSAFAGPVVAPEHPKQQRDDVFAPA
jgi:alkanesulfonate monooxygenase SsuD/methylene tetrahydromethanopterin reductase-like flavin-dependent oxidoreductase (luciferase family)